jgi:hypothetical protein
MAGIEQRNYQIDSNASEKDYKVKKKKIEEAKENN